MPPPIFKPTGTGFGMPAQCAFRTFTSVPRSGPNSGTSECLGRPRAFRLPPTPNVQHPQCSARPLLPATCIPACPPIPMYATPSVHHPQYSPPSKWSPPPPWQATCIPASPPTPVYTSPMHATPNVHQPHFGRPRLFLASSPASMDASPMFTALLLAGHVHSSFCLRLLHRQL